MKRSPKAKDAVTVVEKKKRRTGIEAEVKAARMT